MRFPIDKTMNRIITETHDKYKDEGVTRRQVKDAFYLLFRNSADLMKTDVIPTICIPKFMWLNPRLTKLENAIVGEKRKGNSTKKLEKSLKRLKKEAKKIKRST